MKLLVTIIAHATSNHFSQAGLRKLALYANYFRGIGSGSGVYSSGETAVLKRLPANSVIFDVGANRGEYARTVLSEIPTAELHCFEPSKKTFEMLSGNLQGSRAVLNNFGLGAQDAQLTLFSPSDGSGLASLSKRRLDHIEINMNQEEIVTIKTIDGYCRDQGINRIDLLKVDVEGHEMGVFHGAKNTILGKKIGRIAFEFGGCNIDTRTYFQDFYYAFQEWGMKSLSRITPSGTLVAIDRYTEDLENFRTTNYLVEF